MRAWLRRVAFEYAATLLTAPLGRYMRSSGQDIDQLKRHLRKGDVLLVCGDQRVSEVIRYLTQSSWSHSAVYIGDELLRRAPERAQELEELYGEDARHLIVEALIEEGVVASPVSKYRSFHLRLCRPFGLEPQDLSRVMDLVIDRMGATYDVENLLDLARYFLPVSLVPARLRRDALELGSGRPTEVICSSMIANAFSAVGFPILPRTEEETTDALAALASTSNGQQNGHATLRRLYHVGEEAPSWPSRRPLARHMRMRGRPATLITPRDFDLSPYFEVIKFSLIEGAKKAAEPAAAATGPVSIARRAVSAFPLWRRLRREPRPAEDDPQVEERSTGTA